MGRFAAYYRVSTEDQIEKKTIDNQAFACEEWANTRGHEIVKVFADDGVSGATPFTDRPAGKELLICANEFDGTVIFSVDRLGRDVVEGVIAYKALAAAAVPAEFVSQSFDDSPQGDFMFNTFLNVAQLERAMIAERTKQGRRRSARNGNFPGAVIPLGYHKQDKRLRVLLSGARILRRMVRMVLDEDMGSLAIAKDFERRGIKSPNNAGRWRASSINHLLKNGYYSASYIEYAGEKVPCPILIRPEERRKIASTFALRKERSPRRTKVFHLLQHLVFCRECGSMYYSNMRGGKPIYYCGLRRQGRVYGHTDVERWRWKAPVLEAIVKKKVLAFLLSPAETIKQNAAYIERVQAGSETDREKADLRDDLARLTEERDRVLSQNRKGYLSERELDKSMSEIAKSREKMDARLEELEKIAEPIDPDDWHWIGSDWQSIADVEDPKVLYLQLLGDLRIAEENVDVVLNKERYSPQDWRELIESVLERAWVENDGSVSVVFAGSASRSGRSPPRRARTARP